MLIQVSSDGGVSELRDITGPINSILKKYPITLEFEKTFRMFKAVFFRERKDAM